MNFNLGKGIGGASLLGSMASLSLSLYPERHTSLTIRELNIAQLFYASVIVVVLSQLCFVFHRMKRIEITLHLILVIHSRYWEYEPNTPIAEFTLFLTVYQVNIESNKGTNKRHTMTKK